MQLIEHYEVPSGGVSSITFSAIPQTFTDLYLVCSTRTTRTNSVLGVIIIKPNSTDGTLRRLYGTGSAADSASGSTLIAATSTNAATANTFGNFSVYIPNYTSAVAKSLSIDSVGENNGTEAWSWIGAGLSTTTSAITSLTLDGENGDFVEGSSASLYGIKKYNTSLAPKATGGVISFDAVNNKWVHAFTASGTFTPTENLSGVEYLVVAGGGGGGGGIGGGGGAGGYRSSVVGQSSGGGASAESTLSLTSATPYTVTVGAGGSAGNNTVRGTNGANSVFASITSTGGGAGGVGQSVGDRSEGLGVSGGSGGGGGAHAPGYSAPGGSGTANQGFDGGDGALGGNAGGGGGAGAVGVDSTTTVAGNGGTGVSSSITGLAVTRAGGGGGGAYLTGETPGTGGAGGGGDGTNTDNAAEAGTTNTGSGGGGGGYVSSGAVGGNGGSGIVIVRYSA